MEVCFSVIFIIPKESKETINNAGQNHIAPIRGSKQANLNKILPPNTLSEIVNGVEYKSIL